MLMVVMEHSSTHIFKTFPSLSISYTYMFLITQFMMPAFFFICGYVLYKEKRDWTIEGEVNLLKKKFSSQIISPLLFFLLYISVNSISLHDGVYEYHKVGYWFTFTLFFFYILIFFFFILSKRIKLNSTFGPIILIALGYLLYLLATYYSSRNNHLGIYGLLGILHWRYFVFMVIGYYIHQYHASIWVRYKDYICFFSIAFFVLFNFFYNDLIYICGIIHLSVDFLLSLSGTLLVYAFFFTYQNNIDISILGKALKYIGRRTLPIYYINFLLLPTGLYAYTAFLRESSMSLVEFTISMALAIMNICICLIFYNVSFLNPKIGTFLFGVKYPDKSNS